MSGRSPGIKGGPGPPPAGSRCFVILQRCLAIQLQKVALLSEHRKSVRGHEEPEYWMYDSGIGVNFTIRRYQNEKWRERRLLGVMGVAAQVLYCYVQSNNCSHVLETFNTVVMPPLLHISCIEPDSKNV
ncbi:hypothetical protein C0J52_15090 [Blattella germanica]|nr:hypothetical protein C0J52_15090 [Blattella germanica]